VVESAEGFALAVQRLDAALKGQDRGAAVLAWSQAQGFFDALRPALLGGPAASAAYDGLVADFAPGEQPKGLHEVERGLFSGPITRANAAMPELLRAGPSIVIGLYRTIEQPSGVATHHVEQLGCLVDHVIVCHQEVFSRRDRIDIAAITQSITASMKALTPLGVLIDPSMTETTTSDLTRLTSLVASIPIEATNEQISERTWRALAQVAARLQFDFGQLSGSLAGSSSGRAYA